MPEKLKIIVEQTTKDGAWMAKIEGDNATAFGNTATEAIGQLVAIKKAQLGIELEIKPFKPEAK
jgi:hypothetical protein